MRSVLCGLLPALGLFLVLTETHHLVDVPSPFPNTPAGVWPSSLGVALVAVAVRAAARPPGKRPGRART